MAKPNWVGSVGNGNNQGKGNNQGEEKIHPAVARAGLRPWDEDFKKPEEVSDVPENGLKTGNNNFSDLAAFFKEKIMTMAKPIWAGWSGNGKFNSALDRSWLVTLDGEDAIVFENQGSLEDQEDAFVGTKSNDFLYIDKTIGTDSLYNGTYQPEIDGGGGADQIIMMEDAEISDAFFTNITNVTVLKLGAGKGLTKDVGYVAEGSSVILGENAQAAGIREVTGGPGDDTIIFIGSIDGDEDDDIIVYDGIDVLVKGGDGDDFIQTAGGDDIIIGCAGADTMTGGAGNDTFIWKAGDLEGTNDEYAGEGQVPYDIITDWSTIDDNMDIADLLSAAGFDSSDPVPPVVEDWLIFDYDPDTSSAFYGTTIQIATTSKAFDPDPGTSDDEYMVGADFENLVLLQGVEVGFEDITGSLIT